MCAAKNRLKIVKKQLVSEVLNVELDVHRPRDEVALPLNIVGNDPHSERLRRGLVAGTA